MGRVVFGMMKNRSATGGHKFYRKLTFKSSLVVPGLVSSTGAPMHVHMTITKHYTAGLTLA